MLKSAVLLLVAGLTGFAFHALAQVRMDARPAVASIGNSSSNGISFAWFYDAAERTVYVCRTGQGSGDAVDCRGKATLP